MKKYTTIFLDIDSITYELYRHRHMHDYTLSMVEQILKRGLKSLQRFEVIALLGQKEDIGRKYLRKNRISFTKQVSKQLIGFTKDNSSYFSYLLKYYDRNIKNVLVVSGNPTLLNAAKLIGLDTCYFNIFNPTPNNNNSDISINKLEELLKYCIIIKTSKVTEEKNEEIENYHFYIDQGLIDILKENDITINNYVCDKDKVLNNELKKVFAITVEARLVKLFKEKGHTTYFVNNHKNDCIDFVTDYESAIENLPKNLKKLIKKQ